MPGLEPGIHLFRPKQQTNAWMAGSSPAMTMWRVPIQKKGITL